MLRWNDEHLEGKGFIPWQSFSHPQLGEVELGGWDWKRVWQNAPIQYLPELCQQQANFVIAHALMCPRLAIAQVELKHQGADIYHLCLQLENQGFLPTYTSQKALEKKTVHPIQVTLFYPPSVVLINGKQEQEIGHLEGRANKAYRSVAEGVDYRTTVTWVISGALGTEIEIVAKAERAGTVNSKITLKH